MTRVNLIFRRMAVFTSALPFVSLATYFPRLQAQTFPPVVAANITQLDTDLQFTPPNRGNPTRQTSTGKRSPGCIEYKSPSISPEIEEPKLIALIPLTQQSLNETPTKGYQLGLGLTVDPYPTLLFYIPKLLRDINYAELRMKIGNEDFFDSPISIKLPEQLAQTGGIVSIRIPLKKEIQTNKQYFWSFSLLCDSENPSSNPTVSGWVERISDSNFKTQIEQAGNDERKLLQVYAINGIWHEAITLLAKQRCAAPNDTNLSAEWANLLHSIGQANIAQEPIVQCPSP